jgi:hypothetical protein
VFINQLLSNLFSSYSDSDDDFQIAARERASNPNTVVPNEEIKREEYSYQNDEDQGGIDESLNVITISFRPSSKISRE